MFDELMLRTRLDELAERYRPPRFAEGTTWSYRPVVEAPRADARRLLLQWLAHRSASTRKARTPAA